MISIENLVGTNFTDILKGNAAANVLDGADGRDTLSGGAGADTLNGGEGSDSLNGGAGADVLIGGGATDTIVYDGPAGVSVNLTTLIASGGDAAGDAIGNDIENIRGTAGFGDVLTGSAVANVLSGNGGSDVLDGMAGSDTLDGGSGNDRLRGGAGVDALYGGSGIDTASYDGSAAGVSVSLLTGTGSGGDAQGDTLDGIENLSGSQANDSLAGNAGANTLQGGDGNDVLRGEAGADRLDGGAGIDTASYHTSAAGVTVNLATGTAAGGDAQGDTLVSIENVAGSNQGNDSLSGNTGANTLAGWGGDDVLRGGTGADRLDGGTGSDTASYYAGTVGVTVNLATGTGTGGDAQGDTLVSIENVTGSTGADQITGSTAANVLNGWAGQDVLTGGAGADRFGLTAASHSAVGAADRITDFSRAQGDKIDLSAIDADPGIGGDQAFTFIGGGAFTHQAGQLRAVVTSPGVTTIAGDLNGDGVSDFHIVLTGALTLQTSDFVL
ncbi:MAG: calcium-binding protein [Inquilinus sp.]|uniref:calcium-binding protein n=1 Tax=Inquilinus sp. TaxID=1932117 RepID=UPI003F29FB4A